MEKRCKQCGGTEFQKSGKCAQCCRKRQQKYRKGRSEEQKEKYNKYMREWYRTPAGKALSARTWQRKKERLRTNPDIRRAEKLRLRYGITLDQYNQMLEEQGGVCAVCGGEGDDRSLHVDHCHETGRIRGLLCIGCNRGLGFLGDDPDRIAALAKYAEEWRP